MKYLFPLFFLSLLSFQPHFTYAQHTSQITESAANRSLRGELVESSNGKFAVFGTAAYRFDSTRHVMFGLDSSLLASGPKGVFRLSNFGQFNDVEAAGDDFIICGTNSASFGSQPYIIKVDANFQPLWSVYFQNLALSQRQIVRTFSEGNQITAYSYSSPANDIVYRFEISQDKSSINTRSISSATKDFRFYAGAKTDTLGTQVLVGNSEDKTSGDNDGLIINWGNNGVNWAKYYDFGITGQEEFSRIIPSNDGQWLATATHFLPDSGRFETFVLKLNQEGDAIWCKQIFLYGGTALLGQIAQTLDGDILLGGITNNFEATLIKLDSTANMIWSKKWISPTVGASGIGSLFRANSGKIMLMIGANDLFPTELDSAGNGCMFEAGPPVQSAVFTDFQVAGLSFTNSPFTEMSDSTFILPRQLDFTSSVYCSALTSLDEKIEELDIQLYPQPAHDQLFIDMGKPLPRGELQVYSLDGRLEMKMKLQERIDISNLTPGIKIIKITDGQSHWVKRFVKW